MQLIGVKKKILFRFFGSPEGSGNAISLMGWQQGGVPSGYPLQCGVQVGQCLNFSFGTHVLGPSLLPLSHQWFLFPYNGLHQYIEDLTLTFHHAISNELSIMQTIIQIVFYQFMTYQNDCDPKPFRIRLLVFIIIVVCDNFKWFNL